MTKQEIELCMAAVAHFEDEDIECGGDWPCYFSDHPKETIEQLDDQGIDLCPERGCPAVRLAYSREPDLMKLTWPRDIEAEIVVASDDIAETVGDQLFWELLGTSEGRKELMWAFEFALSELPDNV